MSEKKRGKLLLYMNVVSIPLDTSGSHKYKFHHCSAERPGISRHSIGGEQFSNNMLPERHRTLSEDRKTAYFVLYRRCHFFALHSKIQVPVEERLSNHPIMRTVMSREVLLQISHRFILSFSSHMRLCIH